MKEDLDKWKHIMLMDWRFNTVKMSFLSKWLYLTHIPIKIPIGFLVEINKSTEIYVEEQKIENSQNNL